MNINSMNVNRIMKEADKLSDAFEPEESNSLLGDVIWENNTKEEAAMLLMLISRNYYLMKRSELAREFLWEIIKMKSISIEIQLIAVKLRGEYGKPVLNPTVSRVGTL